MKNLIEYFSLGKLKILKQEKFAQQIDNEVRGISYFLMFLVIKKIKQKIIDVFIY